MGYSRMKDLNWLKEIVHQVQSNQFGPAEIYYCIYDNNEGFLVDQCVQCPDAMTYFYDCEGNILCQFGGYMGLSSC